jgi:hypothetical protein
MNIKAAIDKLDSMLKVKESVEYVSFYELKQILLSLQEPKDDKLHPHTYLANKLLIVEDRLARIESMLCNHGSDVGCAICKPEPSSVSECKDCKPDPYECDICKSEPKPTTTLECEHDFRPYTYKAKLCIKCGEEGVTIGKPSVENIPSKSINIPEIDKCDTITISRKVAEEWYYMVATNPTVKTCSDERDMIDEVGQALSKEGK